LFLFSCFVQGFEHPLKFKGTCSKKSIRHSLGSEAIELDFQNQKYFLSLGQEEWTSQYQRRSYSLEKSKAIINQS